MGVVAEYLFVGFLSLFGNTDPGVVAKKPTPPVEQTSPAQEKASLAKFWLEIARQPDASESTKAFATTCIREALDIANLSLTQVGTSESELRVLAGGEEKGSGARIKTALNTSTEE